MKLTEDERKILRGDEETKAYLEYQKKIGGEPIGLVVPFGYPPGVEERGGVVAVYKECIKKGVTWEKLLDYAPLEEGVDSKMKMTNKEPYFMNNEEWFYFDEKEFCYKLTDKAPDKAKESYKDFYDSLDSVEEGDVC